MTTNRPLEDWGQVIGDTAAAGAILDRFLHHAEVIRLRGRSYRMQNRRELRNQNPTLATLTIYTKSANLLATYQWRLLSRLPLAGFARPVTCPMSPSLSTRKLSS
jgi:hypothetical protein